MQPDDLTRHYTYLPIDVLSIARSQGIDVRFVTGANWRGACEGTVMWVNTEEPVTRQRFMIAHLLGHLLNHKGKTFRCWMYKTPSKNAWEHILEEEPNRCLEVEENGPDLYEILANIFALRLLIPENMLLTIANNPRHPNTSYPSWLAKTFLVSEDLMRLRMADERFGFDPAVFAIPKGVCPPLTKNENNLWLGLDKFLTKKILPHNGIRFFK